MIARINLKSTYASRRHVSTKVVALLISTAILSGCGSQGSHGSSTSRRVHPSGKLYLKVLTLQISPGEVTPAIIAKTAFVMKARLSASHIRGTVSSMPNGYLRVTLDAMVPTVYSARLLTQRGYITFKTVPKGDLYHSPSERPIRSATLESPQYAAMHSGIISNAPVLNFTLSDPPSFAQFTGAHINQDLGIYLDDRLISAPRLVGPISDKGSIFGGQNDASNAMELGLIAAVMDAGPLPAHVRFVSSSGIIPG